MLMQTIAYLGPPGSYSEEAALTYASHAYYLPVASMPAVVAAVEQGQAECGMLPIENVLEGGVTTTLDLLIHETDLHIAGETVVPIRQCLVARTDIDLSQIEVLYGHPQSLGQCRKFIERVLPQVVSLASLSNSAAPAEALADKRVAAAISTLRAAELLKATILAHNIQDRKDNVTRFIAIGRDDHPPTGDDKTSFCFGFDREDRPGSLVSALQELALENLNMIKLESRPSKELLGRYIFLVDLNGHREDPSVAGALERIRAKTGFMKVFGSYPRYQTRVVSRQ